MDEKDDQIAHHRILAGREIPTNYWRNNNSPPTRSRYLENLRPSLCAVVDGEDHDAVVIDNVGCDKGRIGNDQLTSTWNPARSARHGECSEPLNAGDDPHGDAGGNLFAVRESDVIVGLIQLSGCLLGPFDHGRARPDRLSRFTTSSWLTTRPFRISASPLRTSASW